MPRKTRLRCAVTLVSDKDKCLKMLQQAGHDWIYLDEEQVCDWQ
ncbi:hypothetical protein [Propionispora sp. 2/2-37]|nr:hypothetical protein [Propionispora sp. 2/2-37]